MNHLSVKACIGAMKMLVGGAYCEHLERLGIQREILQKVRSSEVFAEVDQHMVIDTINAVVFGTLLVQGLPKIDMNAEMMACAVFVTVKEINVMKTCYWLQGYYKAEDLAQSQENKKPHELITGGQIFTMVQYLYSDDEMLYMQQRFVEIVDKRLQERIDMGQKQEELEIS